MWKSEYAQRRREKYQTDISERERRKSQCRTTEENKQYMAEYYKSNPDKFKVRDNDERNRLRRKHYKSNSEHREKCKLLANKYAKENPHKRIERVIKSYGITLSQFNIILTEQNNRCKICGKEFDRNRRKSMAIDHCHTTNKVKGILCTNCNCGIGHFKDNIESLQKAILYLRL